MAKINPISGFGEFLPREQKVFQRVMDVIRKHFELYGFSPIETPAVERVETLLAKGGNDKEIYALRRLAAQEGEKDEKDLALRFDLTVPMARYVAQHQANLTFPFKRYQMQPVWRGERPQKGRYRQFYQCDIDVIGQEKLPLAYDAELPAVMYGIFKELNIGDFVIRINNRKALQGMLMSFGVAEKDIPAAIKVLDDIEKVPHEVTEKKIKELSKKAEDFITFLRQDGGAKSWLEALTKLEPNPLLKEGISELETVLSSISALGVDESYVVLDPTIARGLDYYTGTVYETILVSNPEIGSICSGGRYENLVGGFSSKAMPGVGMSIGISRLLPQLLEAGLIGSDAQVGADVLVTCMDETYESTYTEIACALRAAGISTEVFYGKKKFDKQMKYANAKGFKFVIIAGEDEISASEVTCKNLVDGSQKKLKQANLAKELTKALGL